MSAANYLESCIVVDTTGDAIASRRLYELLTVGHIEISPVCKQQVEIARQAYRDFGKGNGHPARLNFGDCFAYALAKHLGEPLLFKGNDFSQTDLRDALSG